VQPLVDLLPLTHMLNALRGMALDGESVFAQAPALLVMTAWVLGTFVVARMTFRFDDA